MYIARNKILQKRETWARLSFVVGEKLVKNSILLIAFLFKNCYIFKVTRRNVFKGIICLVLSLLFIKNVSTYLRVTFVTNFVAAVYAKSQVTRIHSHMTLEPDICTRITRLTQSYDVPRA